MDIRQFLVSGKDKDKDKDKDKGKDPDESDDRPAAKRARRLEPEPLGLDQKRTKDNDTTAIVEIRGDLFGGGVKSCDALAHCVSQDMRLGKGIAAIFKRKYGGIDELKRQHPKVGDCAFIRRGDLVVYVLVSKPFFYNKPTMGHLESTLMSLVRSMQTLRLKSVAMPRIGCGLDGLLWPDVRKLIERCFVGSGIRVEVYSL